MATVESHVVPSRLTFVQWAIVVIAAIGFAFDSYQLLMAPLFVRPALVELLGVPITSPLVNEWVGILFYVPAVAGGLFGLLGGYLADLFGRRRVLVWSILLYALSAFAAGFSTSVQWLLFWRCCTFVGVCVEFVAAVAWLSELFENPKQREAIVGYTQAFGSIGGVLVTGVYYLVVTYGEQLPTVRGVHEAWRYTRCRPHPAIPHHHPSVPAGISGMAPESWTARLRPERRAVQSRFRTTTLVTTVMMACSFAAAFGAIQQMPGIVPGLLTSARSASRAAADRSSAVVSGVRRARGSTRPRVSRRADPEPAPPPAFLSDSGPPSPADRVPGCADEQSLVRPVG